MSVLNLNVINVDNNSSICKDNELIYIRMQQYKSYKCDRQPNVCAISDGEPLDNNNIAGIKAILKCTLYKSNFKLNYHVRNVIIKQNGSLKRRIIAQSFYHWP